MKSNLLVDIEFMCKDTTHNSRTFKTKLENSKKTLRKNQNRKNGNISIKNAKKDGVLDFLF